MIFTHRLREYDLRTGDLSRDLECDLAGDLERLREPDRERERDLRLGEREYERDLENINKNALTSSHSTLSSVPQKLFHE